MLKYRIPAALVMTFVFITCLWMDAKNSSSIWFSTFMACGTVVVLREFYKMVKAKGAEPMLIFGIVMGICLVFAHDRWCWEKWHGFARSTPDLLSSVVTLCVLGSFALQGIRKSPDGAIVNIGSTLMGLVYVWFLPGFLVKIRHLGFAEAKGWGLDGIELIAATLFVAKVSDIGGFFVGRAFGKHKMSPVISPKKTWEGAAGGALASILLTIAFRNFYPNSVFATMSMWTVVLFGFTMSVSSILGDLIESCMKRDSQQKDSGTAVPGFGGLLDVADSLMVAAPASYFFLILAGARPALEAVVK